jgi:hypothetical protein
LATPPRTAGSTRAGDTAEPGRAGPGPGHPSATATRGFPARSPPTASSASATNRSASGELQRLSPRRAGHRRTPAVLRREIEDRPGASRSANSPHLAELPGYHWQTTSGSIPRGQRRLGRGPSLSARGSSRSSKGFSGAAWALGG